jgi:hypothetical protein
VAIPPIVAPGTAPEAIPFRNVVLKVRLVIPSHMADPVLVHLLKVVGKSRVGRRYRMDWKQVERLDAVPQLVMEQFRGQ